jgi:dephospho-CoA kinase
MTKNFLCIGLIGGIGSGKSVAAAAFARRGGKVISGDALGHQALHDPVIRSEVVCLWGKEVLDDQGQVQRRRLGAIVFADPEQRRKLENLVHPWIGARIREEMAEAARDPAIPFVVLDAAIMLEAGWDGVCDRLVFVDAPEAIRHERLAQKRSWSPEEIRAREEAQMPLTEKAARADHVLDNSASPEHLQTQIDDLLRLWGQFLDKQ